MDSSTEWSNVIPYTPTGPALRSQPMPFPVEISSYFRRPAKVVKPTSRGNSPKYLSRRRTTASHSTTRHRAAWRGSAWSYSISDARGSNPPATTRPISWHPNSLNPTSVNGLTSPYQFPDSACPSHVLTNPFTTAEVNGLITPLTQPSSSESCYNEAFTPLEELRMPSVDSTYCFPQQPGVDNFWHPPQSLAPHNPPNQPHPYRETCTTDLPTPFAYPFAHDVSTGTAPPTPDFFLSSKQQRGEEGKEAAAAASEDEVLVGMGLYDAPSPAGSSMLQGGQFVLPHRGSAGKGLKLEETFQPAAEEDSEGDDDDSDLEELKGDAGTSQFLSAPATQKTPSAEFAPHLASTSFADQSFFFADEQEQEQARLLEQSYAHHFAAPIWTDVYSGAACKWV